MSVARVQTVDTREAFLTQLKLPLGIDAVEIGVLNGDFSEMILNIVRPAALVLIDPFEVSGERYQDGLPTAYSTERDFQGLLRRFRQSKEVIIGRRFSYDAVSDYSDGRFGLIYIDGCHLYEAVKRDLNDWKSKLGVGALCGHDYDVADFGVKRAVDEFCAESGFEMFLLNTNGGDFALRA